MNVPVHHTFLGRTAVSRVLPEQSSADSQARGLRRVRLPPAEELRLLRPAHDELALLPRQHSKPNVIAPILPSKLGSEHNHAWLLPLLQSILAHRGRHPVRLNGTLMTDSAHLDERGQELHDRLHIPPSHPAVLRALVPSKVPASLRDSEDDIRAVWDLH